jgi:hypothetical protein
MKQIVCSHGINQYSLVCGISNITSIPFTKLVDVALSHIVLIFKITFLFEKDTFFTNLVD